MGSRDVEAGAAIAQSLHSRFRRSPKCPQTIWAWGSADVIVTTRDGQPAMVHDGSFAQEPSHRAMIAICVRREQASLSSGCNISPTRQTVQTRALLCHFDNAPYLWKRVYLAKMLTYAPNGGIGSTETL
jgi:hypothetical protein